MHRLQYGAQAPSGYDLLKMATRGSARLLGRKKLGQIATGCAADLFAIRYDRMEMAGAERDEANLFGTLVRECLLSDIVSEIHGTYHD